VPFGDQQDFCVEFEEQVRCRVNSLVACGGLSRTGSFRSYQQYRFLQASAFGVAVNRSSVLPYDGHDETCVGGFFEVFRHRDTSSAPPRVMRRLARLQRTNLQVTTAGAKQTSGPRAVSSRHIQAHKDAEGPATFRAMDTDYQFGFGASLLAHEIAAIGQRGNSPHSMHFIVKRACSSARSIGQGGRSSGDASVVEHHH
jgi:hypothetical protein